LESGNADWFGGGDGDRDSVVLAAALIFIPIGQATARLLEESSDGIKAYSVNIVGSLVGVLLYTGLCLFYQPPATWFAVAGLLIVMAFSTRAIRMAAVATTVICVVMVSLPESGLSVHELFIDKMGISEERTEWSPYQKLRDHLSR